MGLPRRKKKSPPELSRENLSKALTFLSRLAVVAEKRGTEVDPVTERALTEALAPLLKLIEDRNAEQERASWLIIRSEVEIIYRDHARRADATAADLQADFVDYFSTIGHSHLLSAEVLDELVLTHDELKELGGPKDASKVAVAKLAKVKAWRTIHNWEHGSSTPRVVVPVGWEQDAAAIDAVIFFLESFHPHAGVRRNYETEILVAEVLNTARRVRRWSRKTIRSKWEKRTPAPKKGAR